MCVSVQCVTSLVVGVTKSSLHSDALELNRVCWMDQSRWPTSWMWPISCTFRSGRDFLYDCELEAAPIASQMVACSPDCLLIQNVTINLYQHCMERNLSERKYNFCVEGPFSAVCLLTLPALFNSKLRHPRNHLHFHDSISILKSPWSMANKTF